MNTIILKLVVDDKVTRATNSDLEDVLSRFDGYCYEWSNRKSTKKEVSAYNNDVNENKM